jgi:hypothetical protein
LADVSADAEGHFADLLPSLVSEMYFSQAWDWRTETECEPASASRRPLPHVAVAQTSAVVGKMLCPGWRERWFLPSFA